MSEITDSQPDYANSRPMAFDLVWRDDTECNWVMPIIALLERHENRKRVRKERDAISMKRCLAAVLLDLFLCYAEDTNSWLSVGLNKRDDKLRCNGRYGHSFATLSNITKIKDFLEGRGLAEVKLGFPGQQFYQNGRNTRIRATGALSGLLWDTCSISVDGIRACQHGEVILLRSKGPHGAGAGALVDYRDNDQTLLMREQLRGVNKRLRQIKFEGPSLPTEALSPARNQLVRIFNNDFKHGGRFYRHWIQGLSHEERGQIKMNGSSVCELDYRGCHIQMLYHRKGFTPPRDPYDIGDQAAIKGVQRGQLKTLLFKMLNAKQESGVTNAVEDGVLFDDMNDFETAKEALQDLHEPIADHFYQAEGLHLQYLDSEIAALIMDMMWKRERCQIIPIHDSFVCPAEFKESLRATMVDAYQQVIGDYIPAIDEK